MHLHIPVALHGSKPLIKKDSSRSAPAEGNSFQFAETISFNPSLPLLSRQTSIMSQPVILVVEDEVIIRMNAVAMIEDAGFTVVEAANADEAIILL